MTNRAAASSAWPDGGTEAGAAPLVSVGLPVGSIVSVAVVNLTGSRLDSGSISIDYVPS